MEKVKIAFVGCGNISGIYLQNCTQAFSGFLSVEALCDLSPERAQEVADRYGVKRICTFEEILANPEIELVVNLTTPLQHFAVSKKILEAGKHLYSEKPLATTLEDGESLVALAREKGVRIGCAPDTFLGAGIQTARKLLDDGWVGRPVGATAFMMCHGHESWHPGPEFYYQKGGGPMLDMGPYYLTALVSLLGGVTSVSGSARVSHMERTITSKEKYGKKIDVEVPTYVNGTLDFQCGAIGSIITTFDVWSSSLPFVEIYGSEGTLMLADPNWFKGPVRLQRHDGESPMEMPLSHAYSANSRGLGIADMACGVRQNRPHRASGNLALHVLEIMHGIQASSDTKRHYTLRCAVERPEAFPAGTINL